MPDVVLQHFVLPAQLRLSRLYYRVKAAAGDLRLRERRTVILPGGAILKTATWFNGFFEDYWRKFTCLEQLDLRVRLSGAGTLRLFRRLPGGERRLLGEADFQGMDRALCLNVPVPEESGGLLSFEVHARSARLAVHAAQWVARDVPVRPVRLAIGYCTFEREALLLRNVNALLRERGLDGLVSRIIVTDQGSRKLREHPRFAVLAARGRDRLRVVEQDNHGGAGGFTRCILEARRDPATTHILLTDDDALIEAESVWRAGMFLSLSRDDLAVSGHVLDRRRPAELTEAGVAFAPGRLAVVPAVRWRVDRARGLARLLQARQHLCSGWWFFAFSLARIDRVGLPLPLFLRGDDVEFSCRLARDGVSSVPLPGVAVRHEALDRMRRHWQLYYDLRNMLAVGAIYFPMSRRVAVRRFLGYLLGELLSYRYAEGWLLCEAVEDYLKGPAVLRQPAMLIHQRLLRVWQAMAPKPDLECRLRAVAPRWRPPSRVLRMGRALWQLARNLALSGPAPTVPPSLAMQDSACDWHALAGNDVVALEMEDGSRIVLRRSRSAFVTLLARGFLLSVRLLLGNKGTVRAWREETAELTRLPFWRKYLRLDEARAEEAPGDAGTSTAAGTTVFTGSL